MVSERLADFLRTHAGDDVEFIKPSIINASGVKVSDVFYAINVVGKVNVVDMDKSTAALSDKGNVIYFKTIHLKDDCMGGRHIAREAQSRDLLITVTLAEKMIEAGFKGVKGLGFYRNEDGRFTPYKGQA